MFLDPEKIALMKKLKPKEAAKDALLEYIEKEFGVTAPKNYSFERMVRVAEERIEEKKQEEYAEEKLKEEFQRTNITPHDILKGDKSIISYNEPIKMPDEMGQFTAAQLATPAPQAEPAKLVTAQLEGAMVAKEITVVGKSDCDLILNDTFRPNFQLTMRTPDGRECTTIGYWVIDEIVKLGPMWKIAAPNSMHHADLMTLIYYIQKNGEVIVRESRNSSYVILK